MKKNSLAKKPKIERIYISFIPHEQQRYNTVGDWFYINDDSYPSLHINVSKLLDDPDNEKALAIAFHELCEALLCRSKGITQEQVDKFDRDWEKVKWASNGSTEPGDAPDAPYHREHCFATAAERMLIAAMGISWQSYEDSVESLVKGKKWQGRKWLNAITKNSNRHRRGENTPLSSINDLPIVKKPKTSGVSSRK